MTDTPDDTVAAPWTKKDFEAVVKRQVQEIAALRRSERLAFHQLRDALARADAAEARLQQLEAALRDVREALWSENFIAWPLITRGRCNEAIDAALTPSPENVLHANVEVPPMADQQKKELVNSKTGERKSVSDQEWQQQQQSLRSQGFAPADEAGQSGQSNQPGQQNPRKPGA